jgi:alpha-glucosidase
VIDSPEGVLVWERAEGDDRRVVAVSFASEPVALELDETLTVEVASDGTGEGQPFTGVLAPDSALLLHPLLA